MTTQQILIEFLKKHPEYTGALELYFQKGEVKDIKSHESHRDWLRRQLQSSN